MATQVPRPSVGQCRIHRITTSFCKVHRLSCCELCHKLSHDGCKVIHIEDAAAELSRDIEKLQKELNCLQTKDNTNLLELCANKKQIVVSSINTYISEIRTVINIFERNVMQDVNDQFTQLRSAFKEGDRNIAVIRDEVVRLNKDVSDLQKAKSTPDEATITQEDNVHEGAAIVADVDGASSGNLLNVFTLSEAAISVDVANRIVVEMTQILSIYKDTLDRIEHDSAELTLIEARIDQHAIDRIRAILGASFEVSKKVVMRETEIEESCGMTKKESEDNNTRGTVMAEADIKQPRAVVEEEECEEESRDVMSREAAIMDFVKIREIKVDGKFPVIRFADNTSTSRLVVATGSLFSSYKLMLISLDGSVMQQVKMEDEPFDLYIESDNIFVTHEFDNSIMIYKLDDLSTTMSISVTGGIQGISGFDNILFVCLYKDKCVRRLTYNGDITAQSTHKFIRPFTLVVSPSPVAIYILEYYSNSIVVLSANLSECLRTIIQPDLQFHRGLCIIGNQIYVASKDAGKVYRMDTNGSSCRPLISMKEPRSICYQANGRLMAISSYKKTIAIYKGEM